MSGLIPAAGEETFWCPNMLSLVSFAGMTLNKCAVLWIGTLKENEHKNTNGICLKVFGKLHI